MPKHVTIESCIIRKISPRDMRARVLVSYSLSSVEHTFYLKEHFFGMILLAQTAQIVIIYTVASLKFLQTCIPNTSLSNCKKHYSLV